jgi:phage shock protein PspC (stress-responsive transcriptional regulator)
MKPEDQGYIEMMKLWRETAQTVSQIATAALLLPTFFLRDVLGVKEGMALPLQLNPWLIVAWGCFLVSVFFGLTYQITAARLIGDRYSGTTSRPLYPHFQFWMLVVSLLAGIVSFLLAFARARAT